MAHVILRRLALAIPSLALLSGTAFSQSPGPPPPLRHALPPVARPPCRDALGGGRSRSRRDRRRRDQLEGRPLCRASSRRSSLAWPAAGTALDRRAGRPPVRAG